MNEIEQMVYAELIAAGKYAEANQYRAKCNKMDWGESERMKTNKLIIVTDEFSHMVTLDREWNLSKETFIDLAQKSNAFKDHKVIDVADANTHHICKYCGNIAEGTDENVLCQDCRDTFGHAFYSEL